MLVVDASAIAELVLARPAGDAVAGHLRDHGFDLHAPHLLDIEVVSAVRRVVAAGDASPERAVQALADLLDLPIERYPHAALVPRVWELRDDFSPSDAVYVALAEVLIADGVPLLTADERLARTADAVTGVRTIVAQT